MKNVSIRFLSFKKIEFLNLKQYIAKNCFQAIKKKQNKLETKAKVINDKEIKPKKEISPNVKAALEKMESLLTS